MYVIQLIILCLWLAVSINSYDPSLNLSDKCILRCELHRANGNREAYQTDCDTSYQTDKDKLYCRNQCKECPKTICEPAKENIFHCPSTELTGDCEQICEQNRENGNLGPGPYTLKCDEAYKNYQSQIDKCKQPCGKCPSWVCRTSDANVYNCPSTGQLRVPNPTYSGRCEDRCERFRLAGTYEFSFECEAILKSIAEQKECIDDCRYCPENICDLKKGANRFNCPSSAEHHENAENKKKETYGVISAIIIAIIMSILTAFAVMYYFKYSRANSAHARGRNVVGVKPQPVRPPVKAPVKGPVRGPARNP